MIALRIVTLVAWGLVLAYMLPALISILRGKMRSGDPARLLCAAFAVQNAGFQVRWFALPESDVARAALLVFSIAVACFTLKVAKTYGRGDHV